MLGNMFLLIFSFLSLQLNANPNIFIGGSQTIDSFEQATIWPVDNQGTLYPSVIIGESSKDSSVDCITSISDRLYCLGTEKQDSVKKQVLWILKKSTYEGQKVILEGFEGASPLAYITAYGDKLYGCGSIQSGENSFASLVLLDALGNITKTTTLGAKNLSSNALSLSILGDKIYISGYENTTGTLWIADTSGAFIASTSLSSENNVVNIFSNTTLRSNIYSVGYISFNGGFEGTLWITNPYTLTSYATPFVKNGYIYPRKSIVAINNSLVIAGILDTSPNAATLWITNAYGNLIKETLLGNPYRQSQALSITSIGNQVFCVGQQYDLDNKARATLWITDALGSTPLSISLSDLTSGANFIYTPLQSLNLEKAFQKFSQVRYQK